MGAGGIWPSCLCGVDGAEGGSGGKNVEGPSQGTYSLGGRESGTHARQDSGRNDKGSATGTKVMCSWDDQSAAVEFGAGSVYVRRQVCGL